MSLSLVDFKALGTVKLDLMHPKLGKGSYEGVRLSALLGLAKPTAAAKTMTYSSSDGYKTDIVLADALKCADCMISIRRFGEPDCGDAGPGWKGRPGRRISSRSRSNSSLRPQ